jgi:hypothetical protein
LRKGLIGRLSESLDRRRTAETSIRPMIYVGAAGHKRHLVRVSPGAPVQEVSGPSLTFRPGALVITGSFSNIDPKQTILSEPPHAGSSENPPLAQRRTLPAVPPLITAIDPDSGGIAQGSPGVAGLAAVGQALRAGQTIVTYVSVNMAAEVAVEYPATTPASLEVTSVDPVASTMVLELHQTGGLGGDQLEIRAAIKNAAGFEYPVSPGVLYTLDIFGI